MSAIKFYFNGIRVNGGKLQQSYISYCEGRPGDEHIWVSRKEYGKFPEEIHEMFEVQNRTKTEEDYFDHDHFKVTCFSPLWKDALNAVLKYEQKKLKRINLRLEKHPEYRSSLERDIEITKKTIGTIEEKIAA